MTENSPPQAPPGFSTLEIDPALTRPKAIVAAMIAAGHAAIARVAAGATWESEWDIVLDSGLEAHAGRMALIWQRTAQHLECQRPRASRLLPHSPAGPERIVRYESRTD